MNDELTELVLEQHRHLMTKQAEHHLNMLNNVDRWGRNMCGLAALLGGLSCALSVAVVKLWVLR